jgi:hypothetical protein
VIERITITVRPPTAHPDVLTIRDAMHQILDIFELLSAGDGDERVEWALVDATMNSPLTIAGEAVGRAPDVDVSGIARSQKERFTKNIRDLRRGTFPREWSQRDRLNTARRLMQRAAIGVGSTDIILSDTEPPLVLTPDEAGVGLRILNRSAEVYELLDENRSREEYGAVEGTLLLAGFEYKQPAIQIEERTSRRPIWCRVTEEERERIAQSTDFRDVWDHRRVVVRGKICYAKNGEIIRVYATNITRTEPQTVAVEKLRDPKFTGRLSVVQYLELLREGELGDQA